MKVALLTVALGALAAGTVGAYLLQYREAATASSAFPGFVPAPVSIGTIRQSVTTTGTLHALVTVSVGTQLSGQIAELYADFNDVVDKDQALALLDTRTYEARLAEATAATEMADAVVAVHQARLERARVDIRDAEAHREVLQARLDHARIRHAAAEGALERAEELGARGAGSAAQVEDARVARDQAGASLREAEAARAIHEIAVEGARVDLQRAEAELASAVVSVPQRLAAKRAAEIDLERTMIRSPVDGVVVARNISVGQTVAASLEAPVLFTIAGDLRQMEIHARVDEADIGKIAVGQPASFTVDAYPELTFPAVVSGIRKAPQVIQNVVTYTVVLATSNDEMLLLPGMTATVRITVYEEEDILKLPMGALRFTPSGELANAVPANQLAGEQFERRATVWRLTAGGELEPLLVEVGQDDGMHATVLQGPLAAGDEVVVAEIAGEPPPRLFGIRLGF
jgi:HlyD family secretion protein